MKLFHVQDSDRPMYVVAENWEKALRKWRNCVAAENEGTDPEDHEPSGIQYVCDEDDLICDEVNAA